MSLYAAYIKERNGDDILETDDGFATYRYIEQDKTVYIVDIYVRRNCRQYGQATHLADTIAEIARKHGCKSMLGTIQPSAKGSTESLKVLLAYDMRLESAGADMLILRKEL